MKRPDLLTEDQINIKLEDFPLWERRDNMIIRELVAQNFSAAVGTVNSIAIFAEVLDHHPDILLYAWNKIKISVTTHDKGGLTDLDFELAKKIDSLKM